MVFIVRLYAEGGWYRIVCRGEQILYRGPRGRFDKNVAAAVRLPRGKRAILQKRKRGFYLTDIREQAQRMAARTARMFSGNPTLTMFEFDLEEAQSSELKVKVFKEPDWEWARFVMSNRDINTTQPCHDYDIVIGPVADDTIARLLRLYTENFINEEQLLHELTFSKVTSQYFFHSEAAIKMLKRL